MNASLLRPAILTLALMCGLAAAQPQGAASAQPAGRVVSLFQGQTALKVYDKPYDARPRTEIAAKDLRFPLEVVEVDGDFLKVKLPRQDAWIDGMEVVLDKTLAFDCVPPERKPGKTASTAGAARGCK